MKLTLKLTNIFILSLLLFAAAVHAEDERVFRAITASYGLADNSAQTIKCTLTGRMTITTIGFINYYDGAQFSTIPTAGETRYELDEYKGHYHLYYDHYHHLWLKGSHNVVCVNLTQECYISNMDSLFVSFGMKEKVLDMFVDINGDIWMMGKGYIYGNKYDKKFPVEMNLNLQDLDVYDNRQLLMFYEDGSLICYDLKSGRRLYSNKSYGEEDAKEFNSSCVQLFHDNGYYMIRNGKIGAILLHYDVKEQKWRELMRTQYHLNNMVVNNEMLYIASEWGYFTYNIKQGDIVHHRSLKLVNGRSLETDINTLEFDKQGGMWIGTEKRGLLYARPMNSPIQALTWENKLSLKYEAMMNKMEGISSYNGIKANVKITDSRKWTWVGTPNGLYLYKTPNDNPIILRRKEGLLNNVIHSVIEDDNHNIWVGTSYGISCVQIENDHVKHVYSFNDNDNVPNETFINAKAIKLADGTIVMQALDHVVTFNPKDFGQMIPEEPYQMFPKLTGLRVNGIDVKAGDMVNDDVVLTKAITRTKEIDLNYDQNSITLTFSALNYARPLQTYYRLNVKETDGDHWQEFSYFTSNGMVDRNGLLHFPMTGLRPGVYHLKLMASVVPDKWAGEPFEWIIRVNEPWWRTTALFVVFGLVILAMLILNLVYYARNTRMRLQRNTQQGDFMRRVNAFVERFDSYQGESLQPTLEEIYGSIDKNSELDEEFIPMMLKIVSFISEQKNKTLSLNTLNKLTGNKLIAKYDLITNNLYKSPRMLVISMRLEKAEELLQTTDMTIEQVAGECGFASPSYFIACFFSKHRKTPSEFREKRRK